MTQDSYITGIQQLNKKLADLSKFVEEVVSGDELLSSIGQTFRDSARQILSAETSSSDYPGKRLTHKLVQSIVYNVNPAEGKVVIGPDGSAKNKQGESYASWVEFGHFMTGRGHTVANPRWWPGYHYMTRSYVQNKEKVSENVKVELRRGTQRVLGF